MGNWLRFVKNLLKTWLDNHVLPGTTAGTEILWLYAIHWRRDLIAILTIASALILSRTDIFTPRWERTPSESSSAAQSD